MNALLKKRSLMALLIALALFGAGCDDEQVSEAPRGLALPGGPAPGAAPGAAGAAEAKSGPREAVTYKDDDFVESVTNRDPFRIYTSGVRADVQDSTVTRRVQMPTTAVEEMGVGHTVERGDYIGRPKVVQASGNVAMTLNWRVDRIRENEVVLTQEDAGDPTRVALTKIIPLREETTR
jgi:hypothetical protein